MWLFDPPQWLQRWYCKKDIQHWPRLDGGPLRCKWCGEKNLAALRSKRRKKGQTRKPALMILMLAQSPYIVRLSFQKE